MTDPQAAAVIGGGERGIHWAVQFLLAGWTVHLFDPDPCVLRDAGLAVSAKAKGSARVPCGVLHCHDRISTTVIGAAWVHECLPERLALKRKVIQVVQQYCPPDAVIASATTTFDAVQMQGCATRPAQIIVVQSQAMQRVNVHVTAKTRPVILDAVATVLLQLDAQPAMTIISEQTQEA